MKQNPQTTLEELFSIESARNYAKIKYNFRDWRLKITDYVTQIEDYRLH